MAAVGRPTAAGALVGTAELPGDLGRARSDPRRRRHILHDHPEGEKHRGWWRVTSVNPPTSLEFTDGFADQEGTPTSDMPIITVHVQLTEHDGGTRMVMRSSFDSREQMEQLMNMGMAEGLQGAVGQIDALLAG